ncbi:hypothetical protein EVA_14700 [gut metagenome]|uniref:Uncharacterized protein n=1 Tax=gut metagenome TaxID=749906 RepID=J9GCS3_9ZZZZ
MRLWNILTNNPGWASCIPRKPMKCAGSWNLKICSAALTGRLWRRPQWQTAFLPVRN